MATVFNVTQIPSNRVPFIDERTGLMSREWYRWFISVFTLLGGGTSDVAAVDLAVAPLAQDPFVVEQNVLQQAQLSAIMAQYDKVFDDLSTVQQQLLFPDNLSPQPELGTMAPQNAASVNITGGIVAASIVQATATAGFISSDGSLGYTGTVTTASLVGKTITFKDGIVTAFA